MREKAESRLRSYLEKRDYDIGLSLDRGKEGSEEGFEGFPEIISVESLILQEEIRDRLSNLAEYERHAIEMREEIRAIKEKLEVNDRIADKLAGIFNNVDIIKSILLFWMVLAAGLISISAYFFIKLAEMLWKYL